MYDSTYMNVQNRQIQGDREQTDDCQGMGRMLGMGSDYLKGTRSPWGMIKMFC